MALTVAGLIAEARGHLQDEVETYRYPTESLVQSLNTGVERARTLRPDYFVGTVLTPIAALGINDVWPLDPQLYPPLVYFVVGSAMLRDDEFAEDSRAVAALQTFNSMLVSRGPK